MRKAEMEPSLAVTRRIAQLSSGRAQSDEKIERPPSRPPSDDRLLARVQAAVGARYRVQRLVREGSLTTMYTAIVAETGQQVEIHVLRTPPSTSADAVRAVEVLRRVGCLTDPRVLPVLDAGATEDIVYYVSAPRVRPSLRERLLRESTHQLPVTEAVRIARAIAAALAHAHAHGVTHGDLRTRHVGLTSDGAVVAGFGVVEASALLDRGDASDGSTVIALGSPAYLSPEQLTGQVAADVRSDVYAFGSIVYEMLAGDPPFGRPSHMATFGRKLSEAPPPLRDRRERVPGGLADVVHLCLARVPADRYQSGAELAQALGEAL